jgi:hypothetical protein
MVKIPVASRFGSDDCGPVILLMCHDNMVLLTLVLNKRGDIIIVWIYIYS